MNNRVIGAVAALVFGLCFIQGMTQAVQKPLWTDEIYSHINNVEKLSLGSMWRGRIREGNNAPLFYSIQKVFLNAAGYSGGDLWHRDDVQSRVLLRVPAVFFMSFGMAFLFWYFSCSISVAMGALGLIAVLATYMTWAYWAEARPYAMFFLGGVLQSIALWEAFCMVRKGAFRFSLALAHCFLAVTSPLGIIQIFTAAVALWIAGYRRWLAWVGMTVVPFMIAFFYHLMQGEHYQFYFSPHGKPLALIKAALPEGRLLALLVIPVILWRLGSKVEGGVRREVLFFQGWVWMTLAGYGAFLLYLWVHHVPGVGFEISNRYMMTLLPLGVMALLVLTIEWLRLARQRWMTMVAWFFVLGITLPRLIKVFHWAGTVFKF